MFYVLDENGKLYHVAGEDSTKFEPVSTTDLNLNLLEYAVEKIRRLKDHPWTRIPITRRTISILDYTYNLKTGLDEMMRVPKPRDSKEKDW